MAPRKPASVGLTVLAYVVCTFGVQGASHFLLNAGHYAGLGIMRTTPILAMGITAMLVQGTIVALLFPAFNRDGRSLTNGVVFSLALGGFLASYIALGEPGKYAITSIPSWMAVEIPSAAVQFTVFGLLLGIIHRQPARA